MAKVMQFTDPFGNTVQSSYWAIVQCNIGKADRVANVVMYGYRSRADRDAGRQPIGQKSFVVTGAQFDAVFAKIRSVVGIAYTDVVNAVNDVPAPTADDPNAKKNFFDGATDVMD